MGINKPFVQVACVCENVIVEADLVPTLVRIIGKFVVTPPANIPSGTPIGFPTKLFIMLKGNNSAGRGILTISAVRPDGVEFHKSETVVEIPDKAGTAQIKGDMHIVSPISGLYAFSIFWDGEFLTKIPIEVEIIKPEQAKADVVVTAAPPISSGRD